MFTSERYYFKVSDWWHPIILRMLVHCGEGVLEKVNMSKFDGIFPFGLGSKVWKFHRIVSAKWIKSTKFVIEDYTY